MKTVSPSLVCLICLLVCMSAVSAAPKTTAARPKTIGAVKGSERLQLLDKSVTVRGYYLADPAPMLIQQESLLFANTIMPPNSYLMLSGPPPADAQTGDEIEMTGTLRQPGGKQPPRMQRQSSVLELAAGAKANVVRRASRPKASAIQDADDTAMQILGQRPDFEPIESRRKYAILINDGDSRSPYWRSRYMREINEMRLLLLSKGYTAESIFILSGGIDDSHGEVLGQQRAATLNAVRTLFDQLAAVMTGYSQLVVYTTGPGGGFFDKQMNDPTPAGVHGGVLDENGDEDHEFTLERVCDIDLNGDGDKNDRLAYDEVIGLAGDEVLTDDELASNVAKITHYDRMIFLMQQSFSGGFAHDLAGPNRVILTACTEKQWAYTNEYDPLSQFTLCFIRGIFDPMNKPPWAFPWRQSLMGLYMYVYSHDDIRPRETPAYMAVPEGFPHIGDWANLNDASTGVGRETFL